MENQVSDVLMRVNEGMTVYDSEGDKLGTVDEVYFGDASVEEGGFAATGETGTSPYVAGEAGHSLIENVSHAVAPEIAEFPEGLRNRLLAGGYLRLDKGLFAADRYILPEQIAHVDEHVHLTVDKDELLKR